MFKGRPQWTGTVMPSFRTRAHYLNITPQHLLFASGLFSLLHLTCLCLGTTVSLFFDRWWSLLILYIITFGYLEKDTCCGKCMYFSNIHIYQWVTSNVTLLTMYTEKTPYFLKIQGVAVITLFIGWFHILLVSKLEILDCRIPFLVHTCMIAENICIFFSWYQNVKDLPP